MTVPEAWFVAGFTFVGAAFGVFWGVEVAKVLELVVFLHVFKDGFTLPMGGFEFTVFGAFFSDLDFAISLR